MASGTFDWLDRLTFSAISQPSVASFALYCQLGLYAPFRDLASSAILHLSFSARLCPSEVYKPSLTMNAVNPEIMG